MQSAEKQMFDLIDYRSRRESAIRELPDSVKNREEEESNALLY
jgi:hypothetical protein